MSCSEDIHGIVIRVDEDSAIVEIPGIDPEEKMPYCAFEEQYDMGYQPQVGDKVVLMWFGNDDEFLLRKEE